MSPFDHFRRFAGRMAQRVYVWAVLGEYDSSDKPRAKQCLCDEFDAMPETVRDFVDYRAAETDILTNRLERRYDIGQALNEAAQRAMEEKRVRAEEQKLSSTQRAALRLQKQYLQKLVDKT